MKLQFHIIAIAAAILGLSSCSSTKLIGKSAENKKIYRQHIIEVDPKGRHIDRSLNGAELTQEEHFSSIINGIDAHLRDSTKSKKILVFFHGGLNSRKAAFHRAMKNSPKIVEDDIYPVFVNWNSGGINSYGQHLFKVSGGMDYKLMRGVVFPLTFASDLVTGAAKYPTSGFNNMGSNWNNLGQYDANKGQSRWSRTRKNTMGIYTVLAKRMNDNYANQTHVQWGNDERKTGRKLLNGMISTVTFPTRLAFAVPYDGLGTPAWVNMKRRAKALFHPAAEFDLRDYHNNAYEIEKKLDQHHIGVLALFIDSLNHYLKQRAPQGCELTIVGHSMGAIVANELLQQYPELEVKNIVHMAAASSIAGVNNAVIPYLTTHRETKFYNLMLHPVAESKENFFKHFLIPNGSLLVHIDNMFEQSASFIDRTSGRWENIIQATHLFPESVRGQVTLKCFGVTNNGKPINKISRSLKSLERSDVFRPQKHGQFDDDVYWLEKFWQVGHGSPGNSRGAITQTGE